MWIGLDSEADGLAPDLSRKHSRSADHRVLGSRNLPDGTEPSGCHLSSSHFRVLKVASEDDGHRPIENDVFELHGVDECGCSL